MSVIKQKLNDLESVLKKQKAPLLKHLNPGLPTKEIISFFETHNIRVHPDLIALYEWHNGVKTVYGIKDAELEIIPFGKIFNLNEMIRMKEIFLDWAEIDFTDKDLYNYLPFLGSGESDMFLLKLTTGEIYSFKPMIQVFGELEFYSIDAMLDCIIECFDTEAFTMDSNDGLDLDFDHYYRIKEKYLQSRKN